MKFHKEVPGTIRRFLLDLRSKTPFSELNSPFFKHLTTTTRTNSIDLSSSLTLHFLKNSCGLSPEIALSTSQKLHLKTTRNAHAVLALLKSYHFTIPDIAKVVASRPKLLVSDPNNILKPKLDFLHSIGFSGPALVTLITSVPSLLQFSLEKKLMRNFNLLKTLLHTDANVTSAIKGSAWLLVSDFEKTLFPEIKTLEDYGVPMNVRLKMLTMHSKSLVDRSNRFQEIFDTVKRIGIRPTSPIFAHAFGVLSKLPEKVWERKLNNFKELGWSEEQVLVAFAKHPYCMSVSSEKIVRNMEFFREKFGWDPEYVSKNPVVLSFSYEKRVVLRHRVLSILNSKGLLKGRVGSRHLMLGEKTFLQRYVIKYYEEVPEVADDDDIRGKMEDFGLVMGNKRQKVGTDEIKS